MQPFVKPSVRPTTVRLSAAGGHVICRCGCDLPVHTLTGRIQCPRCRRVWVIQVTISPTPAS